MVGTAPRSDCTVSTITDGDTFRFEEVEANGPPIGVRLSGIAARELDGSCHAGHPCPSAPGEAAAAELERLALGQRFQCNRVGSAYGRRAVFCRRSEGLDLSCATVVVGTAAGGPTLAQGSLVTVFCRPRTRAEQKQLLFALTFSNAVQIKSAHTADEKTARRRLN